MKQFWPVNGRQIAAGLVGWLVAADVLSALAHLTNAWPCKVLLLVCLVFLPGIALLRSMRILPESVPLGVLCSFGLSILVLMIAGLAANQILPHAGVSRPLEFWGVFGSWNVITALLITTSIARNRQPVYVPKVLMGHSRCVWLFFGLSLLLPFGAMLGAYRLNNGGDALLAMTTLCSAAALIAAIFVLRHRLPDGLLVWLVFIVSLTILLMTSLRGWDIVGHDIEREFRVYTLAHMHGLWSIALDRDPYNACLSITILPEMFSKILGVSGLVVFKVILQFIFAACVAVVYLSLRRYVSKLGALVGSMLFICYPTFINDSAMLTRQGIAYLFFALALLLAVGKTQRLRQRLLFLLFSLGAILSHYSTAYMFVALFIVAVGCKLSLQWLYRRNPLWQTTRYALVSPLFAGLLLLLTFTWYTPITATSGGLAVTLHKSLVNIPKVFSDDNKSTDTSTALLFANTKSRVNLYDSYLHNSRQRGVTSNNFVPSLVGDDMPFTALGKRARSVGLDPSFIIVLRQNFAKVLQLLALAGVLFASYRLLRRKKDVLSGDFICLNVAGIILLALLVLLPVLSIQYGVLRAFQQTLLFLIVPMTLLLAQFGRYVWPRLRVTLATTGIVVLFLLFTGVFAQVLGGVSPTLSMNNSGLYYGLYYSSAADGQSYRWLKQHLPKDSDVRASNFNRALMHDPQYPFTTVRILPSQIRPDSYVYLDYAQVHTQKFYAYYESSPLIMSFPLDYYDQTKNQVYSTSSTRVYR